MEALSCREGVEGESGPPIVFQIGLEVGRRGSAWIWEHGRSSGSSNAEVLLDTWKEFIQLLWII